MKRRFVLFVALLVAPSLFATDPPAILWAKAKCAVCHGRDGSGKTDTGAKLKVADLRTPAVQKLSDDALAKGMMQEHKRMPSFKSRLQPEEVRVLVAHIRSLAKARESSTAAAR